MKALLATMFAVAFVGLADARPVVIEESAVFTPPDASWTRFGGMGVAIDGDYALVTGERVVTDPAQPSGLRAEAAVFLYRRNGANWIYQSRLGPLSPTAEWSKHGIAMKGGIAVTRFDITRIWELQGGTWVRIPLSLQIENQLKGPDIEIDGGRIIMGKPGCTQDAAVLRKVGSNWTIEGTLVGHSGACGGLQTPAEVDIQGTRAVISNLPGLNGEGRRYYLYALNTNGVGWSQTGSTAAFEYTGGSQVALNGPNWVLPGQRQMGSFVNYQTASGLGAISTYGLQPLDSYMPRNSVDSESTTAIERFRDLFAQRNHSHDIGDFVINLFRVNDDEQRSSEHVATLQASDGGPLGGRFDSSGNRIIVSGWSIRQGNNTVRVFDVPEDLQTIAVQSHDFEQSSSGALWQPSAGSTFTVARVGNSGVYRQASTVGTPSSSLPTSSSTQQSIQAEITVRGISGASAWVGLTTRRLDDANYYYVTLRSSGTVELKRMVNGVFTTLGTAAASVVVGQKYRLRLESVGTRHRVYLDDVPVLTVRDASLKQGVAGIIMYRSAADYDNVIVSPSAFTTIYRAGVSETEVDDWYVHDGSWRLGGAYQNTSVDPASHYARVIIGARSDDQIVQARVRPLSFEVPDNWVGLMARYQDDDNYLYVSLRGRGVISLWRRQNGVITQLATRPMSVTTGTWYALRMEVVNGLSRVFVNEQLMLSSSADPGPSVPGVYVSKGQVGLISLRATADFVDFLAYQP